MTTGEHERDEEYWYRMPDCSWLLKLPAAQLRCYLVILRAIQRDRNHGKISLRQICERTGLSLSSVQEAVTALVELGCLKRIGEPGKTAEYSLPFSWRTSQSARQPDRSSRTVPSDDCTSVAEQSNPQKVPGCTTTGERHCTPVGEQHLESLDSLEKSSSEEARTSGVGVQVATTTLPSQHAQKRKSRWWTPAQFEDAQDGLKKHWRRGLYPPEGLTAELLSEFYDYDEFLAWLWDLRRRVEAKKIRSWGFYLTDARDHWPRDRGRVQAEFSVVQRAQRPCEGLEELPPDEEAPAAQEAADGELSEAPPRLGAAACARCCDGMIETPGAPDPWSWCGCELGIRRKLDSPDEVEKSNQAVRKLRRPDLQAGGLR